MDSKNKIQSLVKKGYTEGAFKNKRNAQLFATLWKKKGYKIDTIRSSGEVIEGGYKRNAYYLIASKLKQKKARAKVNSSNPLADLIRRETQLF